MENVIPDVLHMDLRITDRLQSLLQKDIQSMDSTFSNNLFENLNFKKYTDFLESIGIKKPSRIENKQHVLRDLNGKEKRKLADKINLCSLFPDFNRVYEKERLWKDFYSILSYAKDNDIHRVNRLEEKTQNWYSLFCSLTFQKEITPYIHIFGTHLHEKVDHLRSQSISLNKFSMQGLEKQNDSFTQYYHRATNKKNDYIAQILKKRSRIELLTFLPNLVQFYQEKSRARLVQLNDIQIDRVISVEENSGYMES